MNYLGKFIERELKRRNMSEREMARNCNISHSYLNQLIKGVNPLTNKQISPTVKTLCKIASGFDIPVETLQKLSYGENIDSENLPSGSAVLENLEKNGCKSGIPVGSNGDRIIPWEVWSDIKKAHSLFNSLNFDPSTIDKDDWQAVLDDISLVIKIHFEKKNKS